ncbi:MAG: gas vesicle protein GvpG [bacterium (Candidatus Stahlbacteria) CG23_combo_of_CG06-09_8_20_14_all_40_9]|nr:MAG: gas vesicle protein GvpG [bacterium (Candidatus Stahlbacteria) CG23_combo_of_CG06-09_8_20_14_all_40_9]
MFLIDDLLLLPAQLFIDIAEQIRDMAENELYGEDKIKEELLRLELMQEAGEITEDEYKKAEAILLKRLEEGAKRKEGEE